MHKITAIIIDDEGHCRETLQWELKENCPEVEVVDKCGSAFEGLHSIPHHQPDVIFLDIEMPKMNGFEMLKELQPLNSKVIFTTAYNQFALKAFRVSALDYLVKPIDGDELKQAVARIEPQSPSPGLQEAQFDLLLDRIARKPLPNRIAVPTGEGLEMIKPSAIIHCDSESNYTHLIFDSGRKLLISRTLKEVEDLFVEHGFLRIHNSHLVNLSVIQKYIKGDGGYVILENGTHLNVSRSRKQELLRMLGG